MPGREHVPSSTWRKAARFAAWSAAQAEAPEGCSEGENAFHYRWEHVKAVVRQAVRLAELTGADREVVEAAAWLHDVAKPYSSDHGHDGAIIARQILERTNFSPAKIDAVCDAIAKHVGLKSSEVLQPLEAAIVWDADKLTKVGAIAVLHFAGYYIEAANGTTEELVRRLPDDAWQEDMLCSFHTAPARKVGATRLEAYRAFCRQAALEFDGDDLNG
jgi:uncharacterized protein